MKDQQQREPAGRAHIPSGPRSSDQKSWPRNFLFSWSPDGSLPSDGECGWLSGAQKDLLSAIHQRLYTTLLLYGIELHHSQRCGSRTRADCPRLEYLVQLIALLGIDLHLLARDYLGKRWWHTHHLLSVVQLGAVQRHIDSFVLE